MRDLHEKLSTLFPLGAMTETRANLGFVDVARDDLIPVLTHLRDREGYTHLVLLTAVDWLEEGQFQLTYLLSNRAQNRDIGLRVRLPRESARMESIHGLWPTAATYQRELREMFGIEGWNDIPPYRRDFDTLKYANDSYAQRPGRETRDPETHMKQQLYPGKA
jgi:NADH-quinone oxidoreductase subunit C